MSAGQVVPDRTRALLLLAGSRYDVYAPGPKNSRTFAHGKAAPTKKEICKLCKGDKVLKDKFQRETPCESCKGRGWHKIDPMLNQQQGESDWQAQAQTSAGTRRALCDRCAGAGVWKGERCSMCDGAGKVSVPHKREAKGPRHQKGPGLKCRCKACRQDEIGVDVALGEWDRMLERREQAGSYKDYDRCMRELASTSPHRARIFREVHEIKVKSVGYLSGTEATLLAEAVRDMLLMMPREIVVPREIVQADERLRKQPPPSGKLARPEERAARDAEIVARFKAGESVKELAAWANLSVPRVNQIVYAEREVA